MQQRRVVSRLELGRISRYVDCVWEAAWLDCAGISVQGQPMCKSGIHLPGQALSTQVADRHLQRHLIAYLPCAKNKAAAADCKFRLLPCPVQSFRYSSAR